MKKPLLVLLFVALALLSIDRYAAYKHIPREGARDVIIYTTEWCPYCKSLRKTLTQYNIPYTDYDTEKSIHGILGFWALRGRGVPIVVIGTEVIYGYDGQLITDALINAGYNIPAEW